MQNEGIREITKNIMVVDDQEVIRDVLDAHLTAIAHNVYSFEKGHQAIAFFAKNHSEIDLVILDYIMPEMRGDELFIKLIEIDPDVKVIFSSGYTLEDELEDIDCDNIHGTLEKPIILQQLKKLISTI